MSLKARLRSKRVETEDMGAVVAKVFLNYTRELDSLYRQLDDHLGDEDARDWRMIGRAERAR